MDFSTMILSIGTALRRAQDARAPVEIRVGGVWLSGHVAGVDVEGALLASVDG